MGADYTSKKETIFWNSQVVITTQNELLRISNFSKFKLFVIVKCNNSKDKYLLTNIKDLPVQLWFGIASGIFLVTCWLCMFGAPKGDERQPLHLKFPERSKWRLKLIKKIFELLYRLPQPLSSIHFGLYNQYTFMILIHTYIQTFIHIFIYFFLFKHTRSIQNTLPLTYEPFVNFYWTYWIKSSGMRRS